MLFARVTQVRAPELPVMVYNRLQGRLAVFPELHALFSDLHAPSTRLQRSAYTQKKIALERALAQYELSSTLIRDIKKFNKRMKPRASKPWWKRQNVMVPAAIVAALTAVAGGYVLKHKHDARQVKRRQRKAEAAGHANSVKPPVVGSVVTLQQTDAATSGLPGAGFVSQGFEVHTDGAAQTPAELLLKSTPPPTGLGSQPGNDVQVVFAGRELESPASPAAPAGAGTGAGGEDPITVAPISPVVVTPEMVGEKVRAIDNQLARLQGGDGRVVENGHATYPDITFFSDLMKPNSWMPYAHSLDPETHKLNPDAPSYKKSFMYDKNHWLKQPLVEEKIPAIVAALAAANAALVQNLLEDTNLTKRPKPGRFWGASDITEISATDDRVRALIDRFTLIVHAFMFLERTSEGRKVVCTQILTSDNLFNLSRAGLLENFMIEELLLPKYIIGAFVVRTGLQEDLVGKIDWGVGLLKILKQDSWPLGRVVGTVKGALYLLLNGTPDLRSRNQLLSIPKEAAKLEATDNKQKTFRENYTRMMGNSGGV